jgi:hypothetical protein
VGRQHLFDRAEGFAVELGGNRVGPRRIWIDHAHQPHAARLLQLPIDTRMIAPEGAHANDRNIDREFLAQAKAPQRRRNTLLSQFQPPMGKCETRNPE